MRRDTTTRIVQLGILGGFLYWLWSAQGDASVTFVDPVTGEPVPIDTGYEPQEPTAVNWDDPLAWQSLYEVQHPFGNF